MKYNILIVEDDLVIGEKVKKHIESLGVSCGFSGEFPECDGGFRKSASPPPGHSGYNASLL